VASVSTGRNHEEDHHRHQNKTDAKPLDLFTTIQFAELIGVSPKTVNRWISEGVIPEDGYKRTPGGHYRIYRFAMQYVLQ